MCCSGPIAVHSPPRRFRRRGVSVLLVLALLAMTLALSYAMVRMDYNLERTQENYRQRGDARQAAYSGLSAALRRMQQSTWGGVGSTLAATFADGTSYSVTFTTGDSNLTSTSADYSDYPYRVTVTSTGTAITPGTAGTTSSHQVQAVARLVPRKLTDKPSTWSTLQDYTLYQWSSVSGDPLQLEPPCRVEGNVFAQNALSLASDYPPDDLELPSAGLIDEVTVLGKALTATQILNLYNNSTTVSTLVAGQSLTPVARWRFNESAGSLVATDAFSQFNGMYDGAKPGGSPAPVDGGSGSASFDGVNDHVHLGVVDAPGTELTILLWVRPSSFPSSDGRLLSKATGPYADDQYWAVSNYNYFGQRCVRFRVRTDTSGVDTLTATNVSLSTGQWSFLAATYDGSNMKVYQNGQLKNQMSKSGRIPAAPTVFASIGNTPPASPRAKYLRDVRRMYDLAGVDWRPLTGSLTAPTTSTSSGNRSLVTDELGLTWNNTSATGSAPLTHPGAVTTYRLYSGGPAYTIPSLPSSLQNVTLGPDPITNPLGVFYRLGNLDVLDNVSIQGTVIINAADSTPDIEVYGKNVRFRPATLRALDGQATAEQLPTVIVKDDFRVYSGATGSLEGFAATWGEFGFPAGGQDTTFQVNGRVVASEFYVQARSEWDQWDSWWVNRHQEFMAQLSDPSAILFFPQWLATERNLAADPGIVVKPPASTTTFHWPTWTSPMFVAHPDDGGLRWEVLRLAESSL